MNKKLLATLICGALLAGCCREVYVADLPIHIKVHYFPNSQQIEEIEVSAKKITYFIWFAQDGTLQSEDVWTKNDKGLDESNGPRMRYDYQGNISGYAHMMNGHAIGEVVSYHSNGKIRDIVRYNISGERDGIAEYYTKEGVLDKRLLFRKDTLSKVLLDNKLFPNPPLNMWMYLDSLKRAEGRNKISE